MKKIQPQKYQVAPSRPALRFSPTAWAKLLYLRDAGETEIGGFGLAAADDLLLVKDIALVQQLCTWASAEFDDASVADFFEDQVDEGRKPEEFFRLFIHTHPGNSAQPSMTDEETFARVFGRTEWAVMFILARGGQTYARLRYNVGPGSEVELPIEVNYRRPFEGTDFELWQAEYELHVRVPRPETELQVHPKQLATVPVEVRDVQSTDDWWRDAWDDYSNFERLGEEERIGLFE